MGANGRATRRPLPEHADAKFAGRRVSGWISGLFPTSLTDKLHDIGCRPTGYEARDVVDVDPAAPGYFVTRARFGAIRDFAREHVMVLLLATEVEEVFG